MLNTQEVQLSKFLSLILRHNPSVVGLEMDSAGWVDTKELLNAINATDNHQIDLPLLQKIVDHNNKNRFGFNEDLSRIRANQGHSIEVDLEYEKIEPPEYLYHRANTHSYEKFLRQGMKSKNKKHTYLGATIQDAKKFGHWRGKEVMLQIHAKKMHDQGYAFYLSNSGIWLTEEVPVEFIHEVP